jgi:hypothetical protein
MTGYTSSPGGDVTGYHGGSFWGDYWVAKQDASGNLQWQKCLGGTNDEYGASVQEIDGGGIVVSGWSESSDGDVTVNYGTADFWVVELSVPTAVSQEVNAVASVSLFPNPADEFIAFDLTHLVGKVSSIIIWNSNGIEANRFSPNPAFFSSPFKIPMSQIGPSGLYFYEVKMNDGKILPVNF